MAASESDETFMSLAANQVSRFLRSAILERRLLAGDHLVERELASELGVSRTPVREALRRLEREGLVRYQPRRGVIVAGFTEETLRDMFLMREVLEGLAARLAAERHDTAGMEELRRRMEAMAAVAESGDVRRESELNVRFTQQIYEMAHSQLLRDSLENLLDYVEHVTHASYRSGENERQVQMEHRAIVAAIEARDAELAQELARLHVRRSLARWKAQPDN